MQIGRFLHIALSAASSGIMTQLDMLRIIATVFAITAWNRHQNKAKRTLAEAGRTIADSKISATREAQ
jgi:hypothetical protein